MVGRMRKKIFIAMVLVAAILLGAFFFLSLLSSVEWHVPKNKIAVIEIKGEITGDYEGGANPDTIRKLLARAEEEREIKAIVLRINSGGGDAGASWDMYRAVERVNKPVVASIGDTCASGAYLVAVAADEIVATPMSVVGSIGASVVFPFAVPRNASEEAEKISSMPSGEFKDMFADYRLNESERRYLEERLDNVLKVFLECVTEHREISEENITRIAEGGWFTGEESLHLCLVDKIGAMDEAIEDAAKLANISMEDTKIVILSLENSRVTESSYIY